MSANQDWRNRNPLKTKAHWTVQNAIRYGKLKKGTCEICGSEKTHAHHEDYNKPLEIKWLCSKHHKEAHGIFAVVAKEPKIRKTPRLPEHKRFHPLRPNILIPDAIELRKQGLSYGQISKHLSISRSQVYKWVNDLHD